jgi:Mrp family chromosome partitioning ATPase
VDILPSGDIPPNPSELIMSDRIDQIFQEIGEIYDYIIVDTAPAGIVTDTFLLTKYADIFIYIVRAHELPKKMLNIPAEINKEKRLPNMNILLNGTQASKGYGYGYGYRYGYGYGYGYGYTQGYYEDDTNKPKTLVQRLNPLSWFKF